MTYNVFDGKLSLTQSINQSIIIISRMCGGAESRAKDVELVYKMPPEVTALSRIVYRINPHDCLQLWLRFITCAVLYT